MTREFAEETEFMVRPVSCLGTVRHGYTRYRIRMHCFVCFLDGPGARADKDGNPVPVLHAATEYRWVSLDDLYAEDGYTMPAGHRKFLEAWRDELALFVGKNAG